MITAIWAAHCDECAYWEESVMGDRKSEVTKAAKRGGWLVTGDRVLCPDCRDLVTDHAYVGVAGHADDDECTFRNDGTDLTYCGRPESEHREASR